MTRAAWPPIVENYTQRRFTYPQDRIPAMAGISGHFARTMNDDPILGLWAKSFARDLAWERGDGEPQMQNTSGLPSWTWLSCEGSVDYLRNFSDVQAVENLELLDWDVTWQGRPYASSVNTAQAWVKGALRGIPITPFPEGDTYDPRYLQVFGEKFDLADTSTPSRCSGKFDAMDARREGTHMCLLLFTETYNARAGFVRETFLILEPVSLVGGVGYKRVGLGRIKGEPATFDATKTTSLILCRFPLIRVRKR
ncbi:hypothetical protein IMZ48_25770 [Candidatus Bathyarchaeota archaeon]|nr:hypothetical protein [Candidatus Bathyarchaeota archaeon]